tara:strand:+ start:189 stop:581 length:393 start_codon:yes stop_codon:yes gene_type:complete
MKLACVGGCYLEEPAHKICELDSKTTLDELCDYILNLFDFDNDHMHEFLSSRNGRRGNEITDELLSLEEIYPLEKSHQLFMKFDYGDNWLFKITRERKKAIHSTETKYPHIIEEIGQNPEQYPMCDEDWE